MRIGILGSGSGTNMQAIVDAIGDGSLAAEICLVMSDVADAGILQRAAKYNIPTELIDCGKFRTKFPHNAQTRAAQQLKDARCDLVCLAGFMRVVKAPLLHAFPGRILNIHPSLLPAFPGLQAWEQALQAGVKETGCTVHYVDAGIDSGAIILQATVPILEGDTASSLHQRIQEQEHRIYPQAIRHVMQHLESIS